MAQTHIKHMSWYSFLFLPLRVMAQPLKAITMILSVCNQQPATTPAILGGVLGKSKATPQLNLPDMVQRCSFNHSSFSTTIVPTTIYIPCNSYRTSCDVASWALQADEYARTTLRIPVDSFQHHIYVLPKNDMCGFGGLGSIGPCGNQCRVWISGQIPLQLAAYFHELGHNLGLGHAEYMNDQYGDLTTTMGYCCRIRCFSAPQTHKLKWTLPVTRLSVPFQTSKEIVATLKRSEYVLVRDPIRREDIFIQFRSASLHKYERDLAFRALNIYLVSSIPGSISKLVATLDQPNSIWYHTSFRISLISFATDMQAKIKITPTLVNAVMQQPASNTQEQIPL